MAGQRPPLQLISLAIAAGWTRFILTPVSTFCTRLQLRRWTAEVGQGLRVCGRLRLHNAGRLIIGKNVSIHSGSSNFVGGDRRMAIWVDQGGMLHIEDGCGLSNTTISTVNSIVIHEGTFVGGGCDIYDHDFHPISPEDRHQHLRAKNAPIEIGPRAFVGSHTIVLKGVRIGEGKVMAAASMITHDVAPFEIWSGRPDKRIGVVSMAPKRNQDLAICE